jgi:hypothetical protein
MIEPYEEGERRGTSGPTLRTYYASLRCVEIPNSAANSSISALAAAYSPRARTIGSRQSNVGNLKCDCEPGERRQTDVAEQRHDVRWFAGSGDEHPYQISPGGRHSAYIRNRGERGRCWIEEHGIDPIGVPPATMGAQYHAVR